MKALIAMFLLLTTAGIALGIEVSKDVGQTKTITLTPTIVPAQPGPDGAPGKVVEELPALPECTDVTIHDASPQTMAALLPAILLGLRLLAEGLGALAAKGSAGAGAAARVVTYVLSLLGWLVGKMGWGSPKQEIVNSIPKFKKKSPPA